jgi:two-component system chemotaxis sensor kinase CheA
VGDRPTQEEHEEFLTEAQELVEAMSRDLLLLDQAGKGGEPDPALLNALFRGVHTLKGLSGMFGFHTVGRLAHVLEDLLDHLRLGRADLDGTTLDVLFQGVEAFQRLLASGEDVAGSQAVDVENFGTRVRAVIKARSPERDPLDEYAFAESTLAVLTEYEEHRLRSHVQRGHRIVCVSLSLPLDAIEHELEQIRQRVQPVGEVISYLPSFSGDETSQLSLELLIGTPVVDHELSQALSLPCTMSEVLRRSGAGQPATPRFSRLPPPASPRASLHASPHASAVSDDSVTQEHRQPAAALVGADKTRGAQLSLKSLTNVVRVDVRKLDHLMNVIAELGTVRSAVARLIEQLPRELKLDAQRMQRVFERRLGDVQAAVLDVRMVPLAQLFDKLAVAVRQLAREQDKQVQLSLRGAETEVDKLIAEEIADPLMHLVRNAIDHGIEDHTRRAAAGKPPVAKLSVEAHQKGGQVVIDVADDGSGIDPASIGRVAVERGLLTAEEAASMSPEELLDAVFLPGLSTRPLVSDVSGRGVGLDVVRSNVQRLGGTVQVTSKIGGGTTFTITLPITLAIIRALVFVVRGRMMSIPLSTVAEVTQLRDGGLRTIDGREVLDLRGATLPLVRLGDLLRLSRPNADSPEQHVIVLSLRNRRVGLVVERLVGQQDVVIKPLGRSLQGVRGVAGATDLGAAKLVLVLDAGALLDDALPSKSGGMLRVGGTT